MNRSIQKLNWNSVREKVSVLNPTFASIVDEISPDSSFSLYQVNYPYGSIIADTQSFYLPNAEGQMCQFSDVTLDQDAVNELSYGKDGAPMGIVLDKKIEYFIDLTQSHITIPWLVYEPGSIFPLSTIIGSNTNNYSSNSLLAISAGVRSTFMLPNIGCTTHHMNLQRDYNFRTQAPKSLYDHWKIFKEITNSKKSACDWQCSILFFSEKWVEKINHDKAWLTLKNYMYELGWKKFEFDRNRIYYDIAFSHMQQKRNLKPNPYIADTARHLYTIAINCAPGYTPATNNDALPVELIQQAYVNSYGLKKYFPTIIEPSNIGMTNQPIYYSLQHPSTYMFSPKSRRLASTLFEMRELAHVVETYAEELLIKNAPCWDTVLSEAAQKINFDYFHNEIDSHNIIKHSAEIATSDKRFHADLFAQDSKFFRGCIRIG